VITVKHLLKKVLKTKGKKKVLKKILKNPINKTKKKKKVLQKLLKKRKPLYSYTRQYCLEISFGNIDRFAYRLQKEFGPKILRNSNSLLEGADLYREFLEGDVWEGIEPRKEEDLSPTGLEYDREVEDKSSITLVFKSKAKRTAGKALVEALLLSYGFIPTMFRINEYNDHIRRYNDDLRLDGW
jgi:hypothetical protein